MAAGYFRKLLDERKLKNVEVRAAGVLTVTGLRASQEARQIMESEGIELDRHRSSQLSPEMIRRADLILGMTPYHIQIAMRISEEARGKTFLLQEFSGNDLKNVQIQDPMGCTLEVFKKRFKEIRQACDRLADTDFVSAGAHAAAPMAASEAEPEPKVEKAAKPKRVKIAKPAKTAKPARAAKPPKAAKPARPTKVAKKKAEKSRPVKAAKKRPVTRLVVKKKVAARKPAKSKKLTRAKRVKPKLVRPKVSRVKSKAESRASSKRRI